MGYFLQSKRMGFRRYRAEDFPLIHSLYGNAEVMSLITGAALGEEQARVKFQELLRVYEEAPGLGHWAAEDPATGEYLGSFLLRPIRSLPGVEGTELGYALLPAQWGKGLATEGAERLQRYAREQLGLRRLVAVIDPLNAASEQVLAKIGFRAVLDASVTNSATGRESPARLLEWLA